MDALHIICTEAHFSKGRQEKRGSSKVTRSMVLAEKAKAYVRQLIEDSSVASAAGHFLKCFENIHCDGEHSYDSTSFEPQCSKTLFVTRGACMLFDKERVGRHPDKFKEINYYVMVRIGDSSEAGKGINYF